MKSFKYCGLYSPQDLFNHNLEYLYNLTKNLFRWEGLTDANNEYLNRLLLTRGYAVITPDLEVYDSAISGVNRYNLPYLVETVSVDNKYSGIKMIDGKDCVICYNTSNKLMPTPEIPRMRLFSNILTNIDLSIQTGVFNSRMPMIFRASTKEEAEAYRQLYNDVASGKPAVVETINKLLDDSNDTYFINRTDYVSDNLETLLRVKKQVLNEYLESLGLYVPPIEKSERLVVNETVNSLSELSSHNLKDAREEVVGKLKDWFGVSITLEMRNVDVSKQNSTTEDSEQRSI